MHLLRQRPLLIGLGLLGGGLLARAVWRRMTAYSFQNRVVVVTGGSRGLGLVLARQLAREGARLALCARNAEELRVATNELRRKGATVWSQPCDVTDPDQVQRFMAGVRANLGPVDVLINNAGAIQVGPMEEMTAEDYQAALNIHFWGVFNTVQAVVQEMRARGAGRIVNISSIGGKISIPHLLPYSMSKFALAGYSQGLRAELAKEGITVTTVFPGLMQTGSAGQAKFKGRHREEYAWFCIGASLPFISLDAEEAARQVLNACRYGNAEAVLSLPARLGVLANVLAPELVARLLQLNSQFLPGPGGIGTQQRLGKQSESEWSPSWLTTANDRAARRNNELFNN